MWPIKVLRVAEFFLIEEVKALTTFDYRIGLLELIYTDGLDF